MTVQNTYVLLTFGAVEPNQDTGSKKKLENDSLVIFERNVIEEPLVPIENIIISPLHIKLRLMKQNIEDLD